MSVKTNQLLDIEEEAKLKVQKGTFKRLLQEILIDRHILILGAFLMLLSTVATIADPWLFGAAIDRVLVPRKLEWLGPAALIIISVVGVRVVSTIFQAYLFERLGQNVMQRLRRKIFTKFQILPVATFDKNPTGRLVTRVTSDVSALADMFSSGFVMIGGNLLVIFGTAFWLLVLDFRLGLVAIAVFPPLSVSMVYFSGRLQTAYRNSRSKLSAVTAFLAENILGMKVVFLFNRTVNRVARFEQVNESYSQAQIGTVKVFALLQPAITLFSGIAMALVVYFGAMRAAQGQVSVGVLVAFFTYTFAVFQPMRDLADKWNVFLAGMTSAERIFAILDWEHELEPERALVPLPAPTRFKGEIIFEDVTFAYEPGRPVLKNFSLTIQPGMKVGIVGHTGAGKTTIISLLLRFYEVTSGRILLDGKDLREWDKRELRAAIGIIQQDVFLFSGSVEENVTLWDEKRSVQLERVHELKQWVEGRRDLQLDERGSNLSAGERQLLAFSRAVSAVPSIWILDEATANIDSETELKLGQALERESQGQTTLMIAHRLATVSRCDLILVLNHGQCVEQGTHSSLISRGGLYERLYRLQSMESAIQ